MSTTFTVNKSEAEWEVILSHEQFRILREKGTEEKGTGEYEKHSAPGVYNCAGCGAALYKSTTKFDSGCGWPAFFDSIPGAVDRQPDNSNGKNRTEIICAACGGHLGHVYKGEGFSTPSTSIIVPIQNQWPAKFLFFSADVRHCVNSVSIKFHDEK